MGYRPCGLRELDMTEHAHTPQVPWNTVLPSFPPCCAFLPGPCGHPPSGPPLVSLVSIQPLLSFLLTLEPLEVRPSSVAPDPAESRGAPPSPQDPPPLRGTLGSSLRSSAEGQGNEGFPPPPEKDLESPSSTRLEALVPSRDSRARTRSPSPHA